MCGWGPLAVALTVAAAVCSLSGSAAAQTFEERWSPIPRAHAAPSSPSSPDPAASNAAEPSPPAAAGGTASNRTGQRRAVFVGRASYYEYRKGKTASGAPFNAQALTAAHRTLPFGTRLRVTDLKTRKSVEVTITDRGPAARSRVIDLSLGAAKALGVGTRGVIQVRAEVVDG